MYKVRSKGSQPNILRVNELILKSQSVYKLILLKVFGRANRISRLLITVGNRCKVEKLRRVCQTNKMKKVDVRALRKNLCKKGMSLKEIHEDFMEVLGKEYAL